MSYSNKKLIRWIAKVVFFSIFLLGSTINAIADEKQIDAAGRQIDEDLESFNKQAEYAFDPSRKSSDYQETKKACPYIMNSYYREAAKKPNAIFAYLKWRIKVLKVIKKLERPLPVCFKSKRENLNVQGANIVEFNNMLFEKYSERFDKEYTLTYYVQPSDDRQLGKKRANSIKSETVPPKVSRKMNISHFVIKEDDDLNLKRSVEYECNN